MNKINPVYRIKEVHKKFLSLIPHYDLNDLMKWGVILEQFPIVKKGKVNTILKTNSSKVMMGIGVNHLKSVASIVNIPGTYINEVSKYQNSGTYKNELRRFTLLLLNATYHAVLQTGEN